MITLPALLEHRARATPDALAFVFLDGPRVHRRTWSETAARARGMAHQLDEAGLAAGDRALLSFSEGLGFLDAWFGCLAAGVVAVPAHPPDPRRLARTLPRARAILDDCAPRAILTEPALMEAIAGLAGDRPVVVPREADGPERTAPSPGAVASLQYTSGSTSAPRGVVVGHDNLVRQLETFDEGLQHGPDTVIVTWLPATHDLGMVYGRLMGPFKGVPTVFLDPAAFMGRPRVWLEALTAWRGTHTPTPNFGLEVAASRVDDLTGLDLRSVRVVLNGAEPIRRASEARFVERFAPAGLGPRVMLHAMGMSEATAKIVAEPVDRDARFLTVDPTALAAGRAEPSEAPDALVIAGNGAPCQDTRIAIVQPDTRDVLPERTVGELWVCGSTVARGYWNRPEATDALFRARTSDGGGPWLRTGDLGFLHDGELYLVGRSKDVLVIRGQNHHPQDLEWAVEGAHPALRPGAAIAFGVQGPDGVEGIGLVAEVREDPPDPSEVFGALRGALGDLGLGADHLALLPKGAIPKTSSGKLQRSAARQAFLDGSLPVLHRWDRGVSGSSGPSAGDPRSLLIREVCTLTGLDPDEVDDDLPLRELGLDSVTAVSLVERVGRALGREVPTSALFDHPTLAALTRFLGGAPSGPPEARAPAPSDGHAADVAAMTEAEAEAALLAELEELGR